MLNNRNHLHKSHPAIALDFPMARRPDSAGPSRTSPKSKFSRIRFFLNSRQVSLRSSAASSSSSASAAQPLLLTSTHHDEEIQAQLKTPRLLPSSSANSTIANNEDLLTLILRYLPPKSLLRFQAVSKPWRLFISSPTFRRLHSRFYPTTATFSAEAATAPLFVFREIDGAPDLNFISLCVKDMRSMAIVTSRLLGKFRNGEIMSLHSCNGLLSMDFKFNDDDSREFVVYNPTTNQHRMIPRCEPEEEGFDFLTINIAFDPVKSDHYKLVSVWADDVRNEYLLMAYSSETRIWREFDRINEVVGESYDFEKGVLWNGDLYWASEWCGILCFDLVNECMREELIPNPPTPYHWYNLCYFGESGGDLYYIGLNHFVTKQLEVFSLKRDRSDWVVKYCVDVAPLITLYPSMLVEGNVSRVEPWYNFYVPYLLVDEKDKKPKLVISLERRIISYDTDDMTVREIAEVDPGELSHSFKHASYYGWREVYQHIETLASIK